jgi:hypothetical protein
MSHLPQLISALDAAMKIRDQGFTHTELAMCEIIQSLISREKVWGHGLEFVAPQKIGASRGIFG